jgi:hypothetical protein
MFERLEKPFLTVETGEAYQPVRLMYQIHQLDNLKKLLSECQCLELKQGNGWSWFWTGECSDLHFESISSYKRNSEQPVRLGTLSIREDKLYINLPSFKRACLAVPFFHHLLKPELAAIQLADFLNKVFGLTERLPHGFTELFDEKELQNIVKKRHEDFENAQAHCEQAITAEEALTTLAEYSRNEAKKRLPYAERYTFYNQDSKDVDVEFLAFYIFLRSRELVAIRRWFGETGFSLADAAEETMDQVFGGMDIDIIE